MDVRPQHTTREPGRKETEHSPLKLLVETGLHLASERNLDRLVQTALDTGRILCGAEWGGFFYTVLAADGAPCPLFKVTGDTLDDRHFPLPVSDSLFTEAAFGSGTVRCADISPDAHFGPGTPFAQLTAGPNPVRSYFAVPVHSAMGAILGGLVYFHRRPHVFTAEAEPLLETLAAQAAVAIENILLQEHYSREAAQAGAARTLQRATADRLTQVLEATTDAIFLLDRNWRFTYLNPRANELIAHGRQLAGINIWDAFPEAVGSTFQLRYTDAMNGSFTEFTEFYPPINAWFSVKAYPVPDGVAVFFQDVTDDRRVAREKAQAERRLTQALDAAQLGTWTWDRTTDMLDLDERAAEFFHADPHVPISRSLLRDRVVMQDDRGITTTNLQSSLENGGLYQAEYRIQAPDGTVSWLAASGIATFTEGSVQVSGMIGTVQDITLRKTQESALRQSEKLAATGRLAATIAHEINNPLEAVTNLIFLVKTDPTVPPAAQHLLETADQELARVAQIAQQTLGFYRDTTRPVRIDLADLLKNVVTLFHRKLSYKKIDCTLDLAPELFVFGLQGELRQVFSNLVVNAIDASLHGRITIRGRHRTVNGVRGVVVLVCDEGSGIPAAVRERLFSPFFTTKLSVGTGLGLWVTRGIVEKQGGSIRFRSRATATTGTIFRVFLRAEDDKNSQFSTPEPKFLQ